MYKSQNVEGQQSLPLRALLCAAYICSPDNLFINGLKSMSSEVTKSADDMNLFKIKKTGGPYEELHREFTRLSD